MYKFTYHDPAENIHCASTISNKKKESKQYFQKEEAFNHQFSSRKHMNSDPIVIGE